MNMYPLNEFNNKFDEFKKDIDWMIDHVQQTWDSVTWLVSFAKRVEPRLDRLEFYADMLPGSQAVAADLKVENERLRNRQNNTAIIFGKVSTINAGANPPRVEVRSTAGSIFIVEIPEDLFNATMLQVGLMVRIEARLKNHTIPRRGTFAIFNATSIEKINFGTVDQNLEAGYNDK